MLRLTAKFNVQLSDGSLLVCRELTEELQYRARIGGFDVELCLNPDFQAWRNLHGYSRPKAKESPYFGLSRILVLVSGEEQADPPPARVVNGITTYEERHRYFDERKPVYRAIAWEALDRTICYFKYTLHNPQLSTPGLYSEDFQNPSWADGTGQEFKLAARTFVGYPLPDLTSFGVRCLSASEDLHLEQALERPVEPKLHEELLADALAAIYQGNLRRGALEMAIACEVAVKQVFFARSSIAGEAYEYLESKRRVTVSVSELLDGAAMQAFGESFKTAHPVAFEGVDYLFRCRNKIAHRGEAWYLDKRGTRHELDRSSLAEWWKAVEELLNWLDGHAQKWQ